MIASSSRLAFTHRSSNCHFTCCYTSRTANTHHFGMNSALLRPGTHHQTSPSLLISPLSAHHGYYRASTPRRRFWEHPSRLGLARKAVSQVMRAVWAFDFDGVICDSVGESSIAAWKAASRVWPDIFESESALQQKASVLEKMRAARPVIETGYENIVQVRCLLEGESVEKILNEWHALLPQYMQQWKLERSQLVETFGSTRDDWMRQDLQEWLESNGIYTSTPKILKHLMSKDEVYIVTTKQARFTEALMKDMAQVPFEADRIFSQAESGRPKTEVLRMLEQRHPGTQYHFIEDKFGTLEKVIAEDDLKAWELYLVDWGYNTAAERQAAKETGRVNVIDKAALEHVAHQ